MDKVFNTAGWRMVAVDPLLQGGGERRRRRERKYVQLFYDHVIGDRHNWKGYIEVRAHYSAPVKYWLVHACDDEKPYALMNDEVVRVTETLLYRENGEAGTLPGFAEAALNARRTTTHLQLQEVLLRLVASSPRPLPFATLRQQAAKGGFFGRVRWVGGYSEAIRALCEQRRVERENERLKAKFADHELIRAVQPDPVPVPGADVIPIRRVA